MGNRQINYLKAGFVAATAIYGFVCARDVASFLDRVDLIPHEAGHLLFGFLGEFIGVLGGTIGQLLVPVGITIYFISQRQYFSSSVTVFWIGQNMFNISVYIKDASVMELPLVNIGGGEGIHDWNYILLKLNVLAYDQRIGQVVYALGVLLIVVSVIAGLFFSFEKAEATQTLPV